MARTLRVDTYSSLVLQLRVDTNLIAMRGVVAALLAACALAGAQSGDGEVGIVPDDVVLACPLEEGPNDLVTILRNPDDCSKFYKCAHGLPVEKNCPKGLLFNDNLKVCDWPSNVDCGGSKPTEAPATLPPEPTNAPTPAPSKPPTPEPTKPPTLETTEKPVVPTVSCPAEDPQDGEAVILPNPDDSNSFYICSWGVPHLTRCTEGLVFNAQLKVCDWPENVNGGGSETTEDPATLPPAPTKRPTRKPTRRPPRRTTTTTAAPAVSCPAEDPQDGEAVILPNPDDSNSFYICSSGVPHLTKCPEGLVFNAELKVCAWPDNENGGGSETTEDPATLPPAPTKRPTRKPTRRPPRRTTTTTAAPAVSCPAEDPQDGNATILANPEDSSSFYICSWGVPYLQRCSDGLVFNDELKVCDWPQNVNDGGLNPTEEPATLSPEPTKPPTPELATNPAASAVSCPNEDPQEREAVILPNLEDPKSFFICSWGVPYLQKCPADLSFNRQLRVCS